jgi:hypothetical protein
VAGNFSAGPGRKVCQELATMNNSFMKYLPDGFAIASFENMLRRKNQWLHFQQVLKTNKQTNLIHELIQVNEPWQKLR